MSFPDFDLKSEKLLNEVHPKLKELMKEVLKRSQLHFKVTEGVRTKKRQLELLSQGKSLTSNSRHLTGHAIDIAILVNDKVSWEFKYYKSFSDLVKTVAKELNIDITWGGDWENIRDGVHFELTRSR